MNAIPATIVAILVGVTDGDTIKVWRDRQVETIRLACIDAPEIRQQPWGMAARDRARPNRRNATSASLIFASVLIE